jgi:DNA-binding MarR family transcriptional regulator
MMGNTVLPILDIINHIRAISATNKEDLERAAARLQLDSSIQLNILWIVYCNQGVRITTIAEWTFWHTSSIVIHVKKLMEKGLVSIVKSDQDGRVVNVFLTDEGIRIMHHYFEMVPQIFQVTRALEEMSKRYSPTVTQLFMELLNFLAVELQGEDKVNWSKESEYKITTLEVEVKRIKEHASEVQLNTT